MTLFGLAYGLGLHLYAGLMFPRIFRQWSKYKGNSRQRLGNGFPRIIKGNRTLIWIHAVSFGETKAVAPSYQTTQSCSMHLSSSFHHYETGHAEGLKSSPLADYHAYLPFDFSYMHLPLLQRSKPDIGCFH